MGFLDRAKEAAQRARSGARVAREQGQHRINELQARRQAEVLLREVGLASYEEKQGIGGQEAVVRAVAKLDEHVRAHNIDLSTSGLRGYLRTATGGGDDTGRVGRPATETPTRGAKDESDRGTGNPRPGAAAGQPADDSRDTTDGSGSEDDPATDAGSGTEPAAEAGGGTKPAAAKTTSKPTGAKTTAKKTATAKKTTTKTTAKKTAVKKTTSAGDAEPPPADGGQ